jgi:transcription initiation factor TFIIIB Brf1 subunit/transcription initiation factor TFIIB
MTRQNDQLEKTQNIGRHKRRCTVCNHEQIHEIEAAFISWQSPAMIAVEFGLADRASVYRHAQAFNLSAKRDRNLKSALEKIIERAGEVDVTASAVVSAIQAYAKINAAGQWVDRSEQVNLNDLFDRMTAFELESYAQNGKLPEWFPPIAAIATDGRDAD